MRNACKPSVGSPGDPANRLLDHGNCLAYGLAVRGYPPSVNSRWRRAAIWCQTRSSLRCDLAARSARSVTNRAARTTTGPYKVGITLGDGDGAALRRLRLCSTTVSS